jgi:6-pyruvoyltetrahydropterin/6-carboxytetrahydropterin synthase
VAVSGEIVQGGAKDGMIMDFADLSKIVESEIISQWDHQFLNDILPFTSTAENLAVECFKRIEAKGINITKVKLWETAKSFVEVCKD